MKPTSELAPSGLAMLINAHLLGSLTARCQTLYGPCLLESLDGGGGSQDPVLSAWRVDYDICHKIRL